VKRSGRCPKCEHERLFHSACVMDRGEGNEAMCLAIQREPIYARDVGVFEVYACRACGFAEFYVRSPEELEDAVEDGGGL